jgi:ubiquinone/menaquinone biosynthesis C-methylase UbiE
MLGTHYYPWYGKPAHSILGGGEWESGYTNHPVLGKYNSRDPQVINQHIAWAKDAGVDFFVMEWTGARTWEDITLKDYYLPASKSSEVKFCVFYDSYFALNKLGTLFSYNFDDEYTTSKTKGQKFLEDFEYLADTYFNHPQYLKINGRPVVIIYSAYAFKNNSKYFEQLKINMKKRDLSLFLIADAICWAGVKLSKKNLAFIWQTPPQETFKIFYRVIRRLSLNNLAEDIFLNKYFDGLTGYNMYSANRTSNFLENVDKVYQKFYNYACLHNLCFIPTVMPGYDDRNLSGLNRPILERKEGKFYGDFWAIAKKYLHPSLKIALITTFNEWHEGTEIEHSQEYGDYYLKLTKSFADELKIEDISHNGVFETHKNVQRENSLTEDKIEKDYWEGLWKDVEHTMSPGGLYYMGDTIKLEYILSYLTKEKGNLKILEVGCGSARLSCFLASYGYDITGLDDSENALRVAKNNFALTNNKGKFIIGDVKNLPFRNNSYDVVMSTGLLEHFKDPQPVINEMVRVLKNGGLFYSDILPNKFSLMRLRPHGFVDKFMQILKKKNKKVIIYENKLKKTDIERLLQSVGLTNIRVFAGGVLPPAMLFSKKIPISENLRVRILSWIKPLSKRLDNTWLAELIGNHYIAFAYKK